MSLQDSGIHAYASMLFVCRQLHFVMVVALCSAGQQMISITSLAVSTFLSLSLEIPIVCTQVPRLEYLEQVCTARSAKLDLCVLLVLYRPLICHPPQHGLLCMFPQAQTRRLSMELDVSVSCSMPHATAAQLPAPVQSVLARPWQACSNCRAK